MKRDVKQEVKRGETASETGDNTQQPHGGESYAANGWIAGYWTEDGITRPDVGFAREDQVAQPSRTPVFADGVQAPWTFGPFEGPRATDLPARDLEFGVPDARRVGMGAFAIPRHGSRVGSAPKNHPANARLPGAVNVSFWDGHVEVVPLERLWQLTWHRNYQAPAKRPGL